MKLKPQEKLTLFFPGLLSVESSILQAHVQKSLLQVRFLVILQYFAGEIFLKHINSRYLKDN